MAQLNEGQIGVGAVLSDDLLDGSALVALGLSLQLHRGADRQHLLEGLPRLLPVVRLRHLGAIDAGHPDGELPYAVLYPQRRAVAD